MRYSNWLNSLEIDLSEATDVIKVLRPLEQKRRDEHAAAKAAERVANEELRDVSLAMAIAKQKQAELLNERFSTDAEIDAWLNRHQ